MPRCASGGTYGERTILHALKKPCLGIKEIHGLAMAVIKEEKTEWFRKRGKKQMEARCWQGFESEHKSGGGSCNKKKQHQRHEISNFDPSRASS